MDGSPFFGVVITLVLYVGIMITNLMIFYNYLVFLHLEGRIIDIYTRVTAKGKYFFVPLDNEVSARYLTWVLTRTRLANEKSVRNGGLLETKKFSITYNTVTEVDKDYVRKVVHIAIYRRSEENKLVMYRHFVKTNDGSICELEEGEPFAVDEHPLLEKWPKINRRVKEESEEEELRERPLLKEQLSEEKENNIGSYNLEMNRDSEIVENEEKKL